MTRSSVLLLLGAACASSSAPFVAQHEDTQLVTLPASAYPDAPGDTRITQLVARGDHAVVLGMGACVGKAIDRCLAGAPLWVRGADAPRQIAELRRPTSLLWTELTAEGDVVVHRLPEGDEPTLSRIDLEGSRRLDHVVDSNPGLSRAADGSVLALVRDGEQRAIVRVGRERDEELARANYFEIETRDATTFVHAFGEDNALITIDSAGAVTRWFEGALATRVLVRDGLRLYCAEFADGSELIETSTGVRARIDGACGSTITASGLVWNESEVWAWGDSPTRVTTNIVGTPQVEAISTGWVVLDDESLRWIDSAGEEVRRELMAARGRLFARDDHVFVSYDEMGRTHIRLLDDESTEMVLDDGVRAVGTWLAPGGVLWITASRGGDDYLPTPATELYRVDDSGIRHMLEAGSTLSLHGSLLHLDGALYSLDDDLTRLGDADSAPREVVHGVYDYMSGAEHVLARWDDGELVELARASERFDLRANGLRWRDAAGWHIGRLVEGELHVALEGLDSAQWLSAEMVTATRDGVAEVCQVESGRCWEIPNPDMRVLDARVTDTGRFFAIVRDGDDDALWYSAL